jgi:hypothetical protein
MQYYDSAAERIKESSVNEIKRKGEVKAMPLLCLKNKPATSLKHSNVRLNE